jgi:hypothetical protein
MRPDTSLNAGISLYLKDFRHSSSISSGFIIILSYSRIYKKYLIIRGFSYKKPPPNWKKPVIGIQWRLRQGKLETALLELKDGS